MTNSKVARLSREHTWEARLLTKKNSTYKIIGEKYLKIREEIFQDIDAIRALNEKAFGQAQE